ncbi:hypothetical protein AGR7A_pAt10045 [Agrobacterium deltaense NCPPB 1641]|uniref:MmeI-like N-terminal domain-containing protein n=1 Tax=Agrobacterium deltaense NCPPB 1641 TaxID=1183425 RepID=A0A1S7U8G9_9HYPH|nr:hypothetical protein AGR7A_pAt10045 [Agrobacterium deltaense NCPPB 1641]
MNGAQGNISLGISEFVARWSDREGGQERANYSLFLTELCDVLGVAHPDPASASHEMNDYVFERRVERRMADGRSEVGRIDLYKRGHFILEAKQSRQRSGLEPTASISQGDLFNSHTRRTHAVELNAIDHLMIQVQPCQRIIPIRHFSSYVMSAAFSNSMRIFRATDGTMHSFLTPRRFEFSLLISRIQ